MPTTISITGWESEGLRCPDHDVSFLGEGGLLFGVTLIQMPNGTGKTTTLELLRAALSGSANTWQRNYIRSLRKKGAANSRGHFRVNLLSNGKRLTLGLDFNFDEGTVSYTTTTQSGIKEGFHPPREVSRFLVPEFVHFLIFNGELAENLLDSDHTDAQSVIENLFQLDMFRKVERSIQEYWTDQTEHGPKEEKGLTRRRNSVRAILDRIEELKFLKSGLQTELKDVTDELNSTKSRFSSALNEQEQLRSRLSQAENDLQGSLAAVDGQSIAVLSLMRSPHYLSSVFATEILDLKQNLDRAKLPESTAREFFEELSEEDECVCGRALDDTIRQLIRDRASRYLGSDEMALLNTLKGDIANAIGIDTAEHEATLQAGIESLMGHARAAAEARTERDEVDIEGVRNDPTLQEVKKQIDELGLRQVSLINKLTRFDDPDTARSHKDTFGIAVLDKRLEEHERKVAEITKTLEMKQKRDVLVDILKKAHKQSLSGISRDVANDANVRITELMPNNAIRIEDINKCLVLQGQSGGSVGETLSVAYAFLATLFNRAEHQLPFVVDSPANPIDLAVRAKIAALIPNLAPQFVAFTISSEREGFVQELHSASNGAVQYITLFRKGSSELDQTAQAELNAQESIDGYAVAGKSFFERFHIKEETT